MSHLLFLLDSIYILCVNCAPCQGPAAPCVQIRNLAGACYFSPVVHISLTTEATMQGGKKGTVISCHDTESEHG